MDNWEKIIRIIEDLSKSSRKTSILIVTHRRADIDAYVSAYLLHKILKLKVPSVELNIYIPEGISTRVNKISKLLPIDYVENTRDVSRSYDISFYLDIGGVAVIPDIEYLLSISDTNILIDHHSKNYDFIKKFNIAYVNDTLVSSTVEIILELGNAILKDFYNTFSNAEILSILSTILVESRFLHLAKPETFLRIYHLLRRGGSISEALNLSRIDMDRSEKIALLKGMSRIEAYEANSYLIVLSELGAYHASLASKLASLGVDLAIVYGEYDDDYKVTVRLSNRLMEELHIEAPKDILASIKDELKGNIGGHRGAAVLIVKGNNIKNLEVLRNRILNKVLRIFTEKGLSYRRII